MTSSPHWNKHKTSRVLLNIASNLLGSAQVCQSSNKKRFLNDRNKSRTGFGLLFTSLVAVHGRHGSMTESSRSAMEYLVAVSGQTASKSPLKTYSLQLHLSHCSLRLFKEICDVQGTCIATPVGQVPEAIWWSASWTLEHLSSASFWTGNTNWEELVVIGGKSLVSCLDILLPA